MLRVESGVLTQVLDFVAVDSTDLKTRETGLTTFTVYRSRGGGTATVFTTPTVTEKSSANMPGVYHLLLDEDMSITAGMLTEVMTFHITQASMAPVTISIELFKPLGVGLTTTAQGAAAGSLTLASGEVGTNDFKLGDQLIIVDNGTAAATGQVRTITDSVSSTDVCTLDRNWDTTPTGTIKYRRIAGSLATTKEEAADQVWDEATSGHATAGTTGKALTDVLDDTGTSGVVVASIAANAITATAIATDAITAAKIAADAIGASELATDAAAEIADKILGRNLAGSADGTRTVSDALRALRNRVAISGGTMTVYQENDSTTAWTAAVTTAAGNPVSEIDPA